MNARAGRLVFVGGVSAALAAIVLMTLVAPLVGSVLVMAPPMANVRQPSFTPVPRGDCVEGRNFDGKSLHEQLRDRKVGSFILTDASGRVAAAMRYTDPFRMEMLRLLYYSPGQEVSVMNVRATEGLTYLSRARGTGFARIYDVVGQGSKFRSETVESFSLGGGQTIKDVLTQKGFNNCR